mgnify:FL=1|jgi:uncharacterized protein (TIGR00730 family)
MREFRRICVYCASSNRVDEVWRESARDMARCLARRGVGVVFGGGSVGLMGALADAALAEGVEVIGVIPRKLLDLELGHRGVTELVVVDTMHERKHRMAELSDGFVALPGGWGTLEEIFEVTTWTQLGYHDKPVGLLNVGGYYDHLLAFLDHSSELGFIRREHRPILQSATDPDELLERLAVVDLPKLDGAVLKGPAGP